METRGEPGGEARELVMKIAEALGFSPRQLARYRHHGILQRPNGPGLGRGKGRAWVYPAGTINRLYAFCEAQKHDRRFDHFAWHRWCAGDDGLTDWVREFLKRLAIWYERPFPHFVQPGSLTAAGQRRVDTLATSRIPRFFQPVQRRLGRGRVPAFMGEVLKILSGKFAGWEDRDPDRDVIVQGLGIPRGGPGSDRFRWVGDSEEHKRLGQLLHPGAFREVLREMTTGDLEQARNDFIAHVLPAIDLLGLDVVNFDAMPIKYQAGTFLVWLVFHHTARLKEPQNTGRVNAGTVNPAPRRSQQSRHRPFLRRSE